MPTRATRMPMTRRYYLLIVLGLQLVFLLFPEPETPQERALMVKSLFPLSKTTLTPQEYAYHLCEHFSFLMLIFMPLIKFKRDFHDNSFLQIFAVLYVLDLLDYFLTCNTQSLPLGPLDVTWNIAQFGIFLFMVLLFRK